MKILNAFADDRDLFLVSRDERGERQIERRRAEHSCFLRRATAPADVLDQLRASRSVSAMREEGEHVRVVWRNPWDRRKACGPRGWFDEIGIDPLEADVDPVRRFLTDHPEVVVARPQRCYVDFEADSRQTADDMKERARMLAWAVVDEAEPAAGEGSVDFEIPKRKKEAFDREWSIDHSLARIFGRMPKAEIERVVPARVRLAASGLLAEDDDASERALIEAFWRAIEPYDQIVAWAGDFFDFPYLMARTKRARVRVDPRPWLWIDHLPWFRKMDANSAESGDEKQSLKLDDVARTKCGVGKMEGVTGAESWELWEKDPQKLLAYCERDAALEVLIERKTGYLDVLQPLVELSACFADSRGTMPTRQVEGFLMRLGAARGLRFPSRWYDPDRPESDKYEGAYCMEPSRTGVLEDVHVCDFARLYPNVILTYNLSPETVRGRLPRRVRPTYAAHEGQEPPRAPEGCAVVPITSVIAAQDPKGVLPLALEELLKIRAKVSKEKAQNPPGSPEWIALDRVDQGLKVAINSYYGVIGTENSRFHVRDVAESTSCGGKAMIQITMKAATEERYEVIAGDTDSAFVVGPSEEEFRAFVARCNSELYPAFARERGAARCTFVLEYEKTFRRLLVVGKKRYAGIVRKFKGTEGDQLVVRGLEYRRGDWPMLARRLQYEVIETILRREIDEPGPYAEMVERTRARILDASEILPIVEVSRWQRLAKPLNEYASKTKQDGEDASQSAHVEVAKVLKARGVQIGKGSKIAYVVVDGSESPAKAIPAEDYDGTIDRYYLWEQLVYPPTMRVLQAAFPKEDWARFERVRPPKPRVRKIWEDPRQLKLFFQTEDDSTDTKKKPS